MPTTECPNSPYIDRIAGDLGIPLSEAGHCTCVSTNLRGGEPYEVVVFAFPYLREGR